jgi:Ca-activated chloride channel family protein
VISAKWPKSVNNSQNRLAQVRVSGSLANKPWQQSLTIASNHKNEGRLQKKQKFNGISTWWARQKIKHLNRQLQRSVGEQQQKLKLQITELALNHSLLSPFTSFVAIEEQISRPKTDKLTSKSIANLMPKGSTQAVPIANTALGLTGYLYLGAIMLIIAIFIALLSLPHWLILRFTHQNKLKKERNESKQLTDLSK